MAGYELQTIPEVMVALGQDSVFVSFHICSFFEESANVLFKVEQIAVIVHDSPKTRAGTAWFHQD